MNATARVKLPRLVVIDEGYDKRRASDKFSRFGRYLAMRLPAVAHADPDVLTNRIRWAAFAWAAATPPVMSPGYLRWNDPVEDIELNWDDGQLAADIVIRMESPARLVGWQGWQRDRHGHLVEPWPADRVALNRLSLRTVLDVVLPDPPGPRATHKQYVQAAKAAVTVAAIAVVEAVTPVLVELDRDGRCRSDRVGQP
ncbi:MAG: hypothetical protein AB1679_11650 [Actinomycetota bacterium]